MRGSGNWISPQLAGRLLSEGTNAFRIASGPGFWIERFGDTALISLRNGPDARDLEALIAQTEWSPKRVYVRQLVRNPGEKDTPTLTTGDAPASPLETVCENGLLYEVDFTASYSPGLFLDQRLNRIFLAQRQPGSVLNTFAYTCAFSVAAAASGALTTSVDASKSSLQRGRRNFELNSISTEGHRFVVEDVPTFLRRLIKRSAAFDAIILDPPTFGRSGAGRTFRFERDFPSLLESAHRLTAPKGSILLSTNFAEWDADRLVQCAKDILPSETTFHRPPPPPDFFGMPPSATVWALL